MKKIILLIFVFTVAILPFIFHRQHAGNEVIFWTLQMNDFAQYINGVISDFEQENPDIKIKWVDVPFSEGEKRTLASVLSDNPPDLVNLNPDFSSTLAQKQALWEISADSTEQFNKEILNSLKIKNKLYSIPWYATSAVTIYNKELINNAPQTYNELIKHAQTLRSKNAYIMLPNITENDTILKILNKYGCTIENIKKCEFVFKMYADLYKNDLIPKETINTTLQEALEKYMSGNIATIEAGPNFLNMIKENAPEIYKKTDIAPQLKGNMGQNNFSLMNFVIPLNSKHKQDALKFALFLTNGKNQLELGKLTNVLAVNEKALQNKFYCEYDKNDLMAKARVISAKQLNKLQPVYRTVKNQKEINNLINNFVQKMLTGKENTINNKLEQKIQEIIK